MTRSTPNGDFEAICKRYYDRVWALAYARLRNGYTAQDIAQETFLRLWKQWEAGEPIANPRAWLLRVARNLAEDHAKSAFRRNGTSPPQAMYDVRGDEPMPVEALESKEREEQRQQLLRKLPPA